MTEHTPDPTQVAHHCPTCGARFWAQGILACPDRWHDDAYQPATYVDHDAAVIRAAQDTDTGGAHSRSCMDAWPGRCICGEDARRLARAALATRHTTPPTREQIAQALHDARWPDGARIDAATMLQAGWMADAVLALYADPEPGA